MSEIKRQSYNRCDNLKDITLHSFQRGQHPSHCRLSLGNTSANTFEHSLSCCHCLPAVSSPNCCFSWSGHQKALNTSKCLVLFVEGKPPLLSTFLPGLRRRKLLISAAAATSSCLSSLLWKESTWVEVSYIVRENRHRKVDYYDYYDELLTYDFVGLISLFIFVNPSFALSLGLSSCNMRLSLWTLCLLVPSLWRVFTWGMRDAQSSACLLSTTLHA